MQVTEIAIDGNGNATVNAREGGMEAALDRAPWALRGWAAERCNLEMTGREYLARRAEMLRALADVR